MICESRFSLIKVNCTGSLVDVSKLKSFLQVNEIVKLKKEKERQNRINNIVGRSSI
jgi:hypothetical protein